MLHIPTRMGFNSLFLDLATALRRYGLLPLSKDVVRHNSCFLEGVSSGIVLGFRGLYARAYLGGYDQADSADRMTPRSTADLSENGRLKPQPGG